jgi:hypothetical protein
VAALDAMRGKYSRPWTALSATAVIVVSVASWLLACAEPARAAVAEDWRTYLDSLGRTGFSPAETVITASSARSLRLRWTAVSAGAVSAEPVVANGVVYWGCWDGHERATTSRGALSRSKNLSITSAANCLPPTTEASMRAWPRSATAREYAANWCG